MVSVTPSQFGITSSSGPLPLTLPPSSVALGAESDAGAVALGARDAGWPALANWIAPIFVTEEVEGNSSRTTDQIVKE
jgi:hypothetical protein